VAARFFLDEEALTAVIQDASGKVLAKLADKAETGEVITSVLLVPHVEAQLATQSEARAQALRAVLAKVRVRSLPVQVTSHLRGRALKDWVAAHARLEGAAVLRF
jgi:hypothetical protein